MSHFHVFPPSLDYCVSTERPRVILNVFQDLKPHLCHPELNSGSQKEY